MHAVVVDLVLHKPLYSAIENKRLVRFKYQNKERIVEPHDYGIDKGVARLLAWQIGGRSNGSLPDWRKFDVGKMEEFEVLDRTFLGNRNVSGKHHQWEKIFIRVAPPADRNE
jgi:predicted DNA-binding transcriptional regulator YafY